MTIYHLELTADYNQFYLQDETAAGDLSEAWTDQAIRNLMALAPGTIGIGTMRDNLVPVTVEVVTAQPDNNFDDWDKVNECSIDLPSGRLVVAGSSDDFTLAKRIIVTPGIYRVRAYYQNLDKISEDGLTGEDQYRLVLWNDDKIKPLEVLKNVFVDEELSH